MKEWTEVTDSQMRKVQPYGEAFCKLMDDRFITFQEFQTLFKSVNPDYYIHHIAYEYFLLSYREEKEILLRGVSNDYQGYLRLMKKGHTELWSLRNKQGKCLT